MQPSESQWLIAFYGLLLTLIPLQIAVSIFREPRLAGRVRWLISSLVFAVHLCAMSCFLWFVTYPNRGEAGRGDSVALMVYCSIAILGLLITSALSRNWMSFLWIVVTAEVMALAGPHVLAESGRARIEFEQERLTVDQLGQAFEADQRIPSAQNLSGVWTSGPGFGGCTIQFEQRGEKVEGRGFFWSDSAGATDPFTIRGSYRDGILSVRFSPESVPELPRRYSFVETPKGSTLVGNIGGMGERLMRAHDIRVVQQELLDRYSAELARREHLEVEPHEPKP